MKMQSLVRSWRFMRDYKEQSSRGRPPTEAVANAMQGHFYRLSAFALASQLSSAFQSSTHHLVPNGMSNAIRRSASSVVRKAQGLSSTRSTWSSRDVAIAVQQPV